MLIPWLWVIAIRFPLCKILFSYMFLLFTFGFCCATFRRFFASRQQNRGNRSTNERSLDWELIVYLNSPSSSLTSRSYLKSQKPPEAIQSAQIAIVLIRIRPFTRSSRKTRELLRAFRLQLRKPFKQRFSSSELHR